MAATAPALRQISFHKWDDSDLARRTAASLGGDEIQVWIAAVPADETSLTVLACTLNPGERERAESLRVREPRREFVFGRVLLRQILGASLQVGPAALEFGYQPRGKPFLLRLALGTGLRFNLSHSGSLVAISLAREHEVGVDIESVHRLDDWRAWPNVFLRRVNFANCILSPTNNSHRHSSTIERGRRHISRPRAKGRRTRLRRLRSRWLPGKNRSCSDCPPVQKPPTNG